MKKLLIGLALLTSISSKASVEKICDTTIDFDGQKKNFIMTVFNEDNVLSGKVDIDSAGSIDYEIVKKTSYKIRADLSDDLLGDETLNQGEGFIVHALNMEKLDMSSGVNLKLVRSLDIYEFVEEGTNIGMTAFAEARNSDGSVMGSFMGGFFVSACKQL